MPVERLVRILFAFLCVACVAYPLCSNAAQQSSFADESPGQRAPHVLGQPLQINLTTLGSDFSQLIPFYNKSLQLLIPLLRQLVNDVDADGEFMVVETRNELTDSFKRHMDQFTKVSTAVQELATAAAVIKYPAGLAGLQESSDSTFGAFTSLIDCFSQDKCYRSVDERKVRKDKLNATCATQQRLVSDIGPLGLSCDGRRIQPEGPFSSPNRACAPGDINATRDTTVASLAAPLVFGFLPLCSLLNFSNYGTYSSMDELDLKLAVMWCLHALSVADVNIANGSAAGESKIPALDCDLFRNFFSTGPKFLAIAGELLALAHSVSLFPEEFANWGMFTDFFWIYHAYPSGDVLNALSVAQAILRKSMKPLESIFSEASHIAANGSIYDDPLASEHGIERMILLATQAAETPRRIPDAMAVALRSVEQLNHSITLTAANNAANIALGSSKIFELRKLIDQRKAEADLFMNGSSYDALMKSEDFAEHLKELELLKTALVGKTYNLANEEAAPTVLKKMLASMPAFLQYWRQLQKNFEDFNRILQNLSNQANAAKALLLSNPSGNNKTVARTAIQAILGVKHLSFVGKSIARSYLHAAKPLAKLVSITHAIASESKRELRQKLSEVLDDRRTSINVEEMLDLVYEICNATGIGHRSELLASLVAEAAGLASQLQIDGVKVYDEMQALIRDDWNKAEVMLAKGTKDDAATSASTTDREIPQTGERK